MMGKKRLTGSIIGGIANTQEVLDLCAKHNILPDCETITASEIDEAWNNLTGTGHNPGGVRYVIDIKKSLENKDFLPK